MALKSNAFQGPNSFKTLSIPKPSVPSPHATSSSLDAKFKIDNDEDDTYTLDNKPRTTVELDTVERNVISTTFGAEAVPEGQRPANEYLDLISAPMFDWANRPNGNIGLSLRLGVLYAVFFGLVCWPISGATFTVEGYEIHKLLSSHIGALGTVLLVLVRLYTGWGYIGSRLQSKTIEYEESGWYDGDIEEKTGAEIARDLFLYRQDVEPVKERLKTFTLAIGGLWVASCLALNITFQYKPMFNEYDPSMLERLTYDEKMADVAQQQSKGRPTYCDSRYYSAIANGGQGC